jgi:hypothetical protein
MRAPDRFVEWLSHNEHVDGLGRRYRYHPRSDNHSKALCGFILSDLLDMCPVLEDQAANGLVVFGINCKYRWEASGKPKTIDLAIGAPTVAIPSTVTGPRLRIRAGSIRNVLISCEAKSVMTEHSKSEPRLFDELSSSHEIVHRGNPVAIAAGVTVVNAAATFVSPLRQKHGQPVEVTGHRQPHVTEKMVKHLRGLKIRQKVEDVGFDAYATIVVDCDNVGEARLVATLPAPQVGAPDHYEEFITRIARFYGERFSRLG